MIHTNLGNFILQQLCSGKQRDLLPAAQIGLSAWQLSPGCQQLALLP